MAKEAVIKIKEAEAAAAEIIRNATERSRTISESSLENALAEKELIIKNAERLREENIENAKDKAKAQCVSIIAGEQVEIEKILNPAPDKFKQAVKMLTERILEKWQ